MALILIVRSRIMKVFFNSLRRFMKLSETMKTGKRLLLTFLAMLLAILLGGENRST